MANFTSVIGTGQDTFTSSAVQLHQLGTRAETKDGRVFRYGQAGGVALVPGKLYQSAVPLANHLANTPPDVAVGATSFVYTPGATAGAANLYAEGYLQVDTTPGQGYTYQVAGHPAIVSSTAFVLTLRDPIQVALTAAGSTVGLIAHPYKNVILTPTTATAKVVGVPGAIIATTEYGWIQTRGPCSVLINGTPAVTSPVANSGTTTGAVDVWTTAAAAVVVTPVGYMMQIGVSTKYNFVFLTLD
jgi:hypothetical protein